MERVWFGGGGGGGEVGVQEALMLRYGWTICPASAMSDGVMDRVTSLSLITHGASNEKDDDDAGAEAACACPDAWVSTNGRITVDSSRARQEPLKMV